MDLGQLACSKTVVRKNESLDGALRRLNVRLLKLVYKTRQAWFYEKYSVKRKRKSEAARKHVKILIEMKVLGI